MGGLYVSSGGGYTNPIATPVADYNFVQNVLYGPALSVTRASTGYIDDLAGNWTSVAANMLRRSDKGVLIEEARTNSIRNSAAQGAAVGTPGTLPTNWIGGMNPAGTAISIPFVGAENGVEVADVRVNGTPSAGNAVTALNFEAGGVVLASAGQVRTMSVFMKLSSGSMAGLVSLTLSAQTLDGAAATISVINGPSIVPDGVLRRYDLTYTTPANTVSVIPRLRVTYAATPVLTDFTLRIGWPQDELGAFATSPIRTTGTAATRAADVVTGTLAVAQSVATVAGVAVTSTSPLVSAILTELSSDANNHVRIRRNASGASLVMQPTAGGVAQNAASGSTLADATRFSFSGAYATGDVALAVNGAAPFTAAPASVPSVNTIKIGSVTGGGHWNGYIERLAILPARMVNAELQRLSTLSTWGG